MSSLIASTGIEGLDKIINYLRLGDNVVWQIDNILDYIYLSRKFIEYALKENRKVVYLRFAKHKPITTNPNVKIYELKADSGFESFSKAVHEIATIEGEGVFYVFDCLSELLSSWASDLMTGNFFQITCPYLFELNTIAYFSLLRNTHSFRSIARIRETTQLLLDVYKIKNKLYIHPLKVWNRYSPTMFLPHVEHKNEFIPITNSFDAAKIFSSAASKNFENFERTLDFWDRLFIDAENTKRSSKKKIIIKDKILSLLIGKDKKMLDLTKQNFDLEDLLKIKSRLIGTGMIGGKSVGMLLARKILNNSSSNWENELEPHDSFYVGSDVFYTYIVQNGWWKLFMEQKTKEGYFTVAKELREKMLTGKFPLEIKEQFQQMLEYFGQSPIIVRSSSLLEDSFGNVFAGKYESIFCVNQGSPEERYKNFELAVKRIYASTMSEEALSYRKERGLDNQNEQMALLVQRVSGSYKDNYFFPDLAGVGISFNTYVWDKNIDPKDGMIRLVFGLGTRAVNRVEDDYPKIISLSDPNKSPVSTIEEKVKYSQHKVDLLNASSNMLETMPLAEVLEKTPLNLIEFVTSNTSNNSNNKYISFENLIKNTDFIEKIKEVMKTLEKSYLCPVDIEFTANFSDNKIKINLLQCRPLQRKSLYRVVTIPEKIPQEKLIFRVNSNFMGGNISEKIRYIVYVDPEKYSNLKQQEKYEVARTIGKINSFLKSNEVSILLGPGRWGTSTPSMGVPVNFYEINNFKILGEIAFKSGNLIPELSFGTHMFQDLVESNIFYVAIFPEENETIFNINILMNNENLLNKILQKPSSRLQDTIFVFDMIDNKPQIISDIEKQEVICFLD